MIYCKLMAIQLAIQVLSGRHEDCTFQTFRKRSAPTQIDIFHYLILLIQGLVVTIVTYIVIEYIVGHINFKN